jgi:hypothetical protein
MDTVHSPLAAGHLRAPRGALPQLSLSKWLTLYMLGRMWKGKEHGFEWRGMSKLTTPLADVMEKWGDRPS